MVPFPNLRNITIVGSMVQRNLRIDFNYKFQLVIDLAWIAIDILVFAIWGSLIGGAGTDGMSATSYLLTGVLFWTFLTRAYDDCILALPDEASRGTIGLLVTNNVSIYTILVSRFLASTVKTSIYAFGVVLPVLVIFKIVSINITLSILPYLFLAFFSGWIFILSFSILISSLNIIFKRLGQLASLLMSSLKVAAGFFFPIDRFRADFPWLVDWLHLLPTTEATDLTRYILTGTPIPNISSKLFVMVFGTILITIISIIAVYQLSNKSRQWGTLEFY